MEQTGSCHCFRDRVFDPADRFKVDDYLLTTVRNSLIAKHFNFSKRRIVMLKMKGGKNNDDLLIGLYLSNLIGTDIDDLLTAKGEKTWKELIDARPALKIRRDDPVVGLLEQENTISQASRLIMHLILRKNYTVQDELLTTLQQKNLSPGETALVLTLARHTGVSPLLIASQNRINGLSWSEIAYNFGLQPAAVGKLILSSGD